MMSLIQIIALAFGTIAAAITAADFAINGFVRAEWAKYAVPALAVCIVLFLLFPVGRP